MKKLISLVLLFVMAVPNVMTAQDETNEYKFYVGGSLGFTQNSYDGDAENSTLLFSPEFGYNINDRLSVGLALGYSRYTDKADSYYYDDDYPDLHTTVLSFTPYVRYAFYQNDRVRLFCDGGFTYEVQNQESSNYNYEKNKYTTEDNKIKGYQIAVRPGISYQISDRFSLVAHLGSLGYTSWKEDVKHAKSHTSFGLSLSNGTSFGLFFNF